jgi:hypothetical protein
MLTVGWHHGLQSDIDYDRQCLVGRSLWNPFEDFGFTPYNHPRCDKCWPLGNQVLPEQLSRLRRCLEEAEQGHSTDSEEFGAYILLLDLLSSSVYDVFFRGHTGFFFFFGTGV